MAQSTFVTVMLSWSVNLLTYFLDMLSPLRKIFREHLTKTVKVVCVTISNRQTKVPREDNPGTQYYAPYCYLSCLIHFSEAS